MTKKCQNCGHGIMEHYVRCSLQSVSNRLGSCRNESIICKHCNNTGIVRRLEHFTRGLTSLTATIRRVCEHCSPQRSWRDHAKTSHSDSALSIWNAGSGGETLFSDYPKEKAFTKSCKCKKFVPFDTIADLKRRVKVLS